MKQSTYVIASGPYVHLPNVLVRCTNGCGCYLGKRGDAYVSVDDQDEAHRFTNETEAWQASMAAGWANVAPPDHPEHVHGPYGVGANTFRRTTNGAGDCAEVHAYKNTTVCAGCRAAGWMPDAQDPTHN